MEDEEEENEAEALMHDGMDREAANRKRDQPSHEQGKQEDRSHDRKVGGGEGVEFGDHVMHKGEESAAHVMQKEVESSDRVIRKREESEDRVILHNAVNNNKTPNGGGSEENGLEEGQEGQEEKSQGQGLFLKEKTNVLKDSDGLQGKITNQSQNPAKDEILGNNIDGAGETAHALDGGATNDQS